MPLDGEGFAQRAAMMGYAREGLAKRIATLGLYTDLLVFIFPPDWEGGYHLPITIENFRPFTWCGSVGNEEIVFFAEHCSSSAVEELKAAWTVDVIDLQWGRKKYLWDHLFTDLTRLHDHPFSVVPAYEGIGTDFVF